MSHPSRRDWQGRPARRAERVFESVAPLSVVAARLGIQCETAVTYAPARLLSPPGRHRMILCFSLLFNVLSESPFESVFNPSRRVYLPETRLLNLLSSSLIVYLLHRVHEILEVFPLESLEFLLVLLSLDAVSVENLTKEFLAALNVLARLAEERCEVEAISIFVHNLKALGGSLELLLPRLELSNLSLC